MGFEVGEARYNLDVRGMGAAFVGGAAGYVIGDAIKEPLRRATEFHLAYRSSSSTTVSDATASAIGYAIAESRAGTSSTTDEIARAAGVALGREGAQTVKELNELAERAAGSDNLAAKIAGTVSDTVLDTTSRTINATKGIKQARAAQIGIRVALVGVAALGAVLVASATLPAVTWSNTDTK